MATILVLTGLLLFWFYGIQLGLWIYGLFFRKNSLQKYQGKDGNSWAIVTGATSGIGLAFCEELLEKGWNVLMISRSEEKLLNVKNELASQWPNRKIETFQWEASHVEEGEGFQEKIANLKERILVGILVNNVGVTENSFGWFSDLGYRNDRIVSEEEHVTDLINTIKTNCVFPSKLTAAIIPLLKSREHKYSAIVNVSSILAHLPSPFNPIYGACKAYNRTFSRALTAEYAQMGIDVLCVSPGMVTSNLTGMKKSTWFCSSARETVTYALRAVGFSVETFPHPIHGITYLLVSLLNLLPQKFVTTFTALSLRFLPKPPGINVFKDFRKY